METSEMSELNSETYNESRNQLIDSILFVWDEMYPKIEKTIKDVYSNDVDRLQEVERSLEQLTEIINDIIEQKLNLETNMKLIKSNESHFFQSQLNELNNWFIDLMDIVIHDKNKRQINSANKSMTAFRVINYEMRYGEDPNFKKSQERNGKCLFKWESENNHPLSLIYQNVFQQIAFIRNFTIHYSAGEQHRRFRMSGRKILDPITCAKGPGGIFMIGSLLISLIYGLYEIMVTLKESHDIYKKGGFRDSKDFFCDQKD